jgi:methylphosphotriester-DNA--protein-cysteine methyltransferase
MKKLFIFFATFAVAFSVAAQQPKINRAEESSEVIEERNRLIEAKNKLLEEKNKLIEEWHKYLENNSAQLSNDSIRRQMQAQFEEFRKQFEEKYGMFGYEYKQLAEKYKQAGEKEKQARKKRAPQGMAPNDSISKQRHKQRQEQIQARKVGYFTAQLELTPSEAQNFWPIYNEYWEKRNALFSERSNLIRKVKHDNVDDKKALQIAQRLVENLYDDVNLMREYHAKFEKILSPQKLLKYYIAEESFKMELINVLREH